MNEIQILSGCLAFLVLCGAVYQHIGFDKMKECYGMWFTKTYWTDYNTVEFASWAAKACIIIPGLIFGISNI